MSEYGTKDLKRISIETRTLALADQYIHDNQLALTNSMDFYTLANLVRHLDEIETEIHSLSMYRMDLDWNYSSEIIAILPRFTEVILDDCHGTHLDTMLSSILQAGIGIQRLRLFSQLVDVQMDTSLRDGLIQSNLCNLFLTIELSKSTAECLFTGLNQSLVKELILDQCEIYLDAVEVIGNCLSANQCLETLKVENCGLRDDEVALLMRAVKHHPTLVDLSMRTNYMYNEGMEATVELVQCTPRLAKLDLGRQNPGVLNLAKLAQALRENHTLTHLNMEENFLKDAHMGALIEALLVNTTLRQVNLRNCELKDASLMQLAAAWNDFPGLTHLDLRENHFRRPPDPQHLSQSLQHNHVLQVIELDDPDWISMPLKFHLVLNQAGRRYLSEETIPLSLWPLILERVKRLFDLKKEYHFGENDILFELLNGPALLQR